ncbi:MAG TPA: RDD family protein [Acidobacteria bacterium]|nr:RDD family protein [Acidobacteriota bacterium]
MPPGRLIEREPPRHFAVVTPEGLSLPFQVAPAGDRVLAFALDGLLIFVSLAAVWLLAAAMAVGVLEDLGLAAALLVSFLVRHGYFIVCEARGGTTFGKRRLKLRVLSRDGGPLTVEAVIARNLLRDLEVFLPLAALLAPEALVPSAPAWGRLFSVLWILVFALMPLLNAERLRCGDLVAGTLVAKAPQPLLLSDLADQAPAGRSAPTGPRVEEGAAFTREQLDIYGIHELQVLENLLRQADEGILDPLVLEQVAEKIRRKINWPAERWNDPAFPFLQAFYRAQRGRLEQKMLFGHRQERKK